MENPGFGRTARVCCATLLGEKMSKRKAEEAVQWRRKRSGWSGHGRPTFQKVAFRQLLIAGNFRC